MLSMLLYEGRVVGGIFLLSFSKGVALFGVAGSGACDVCHVCCADAHSWKFFKDMGFEEDRLC